MNNLNAALYTALPADKNHNQLAAVPQSYSLAGFSKPTLALLPCSPSNMLAHNNHIPENRFNTHFTHYIRTFLGLTNPLPYFHTTFSPGARLFTNQAQGGAHLSFAANNHGLD